jgi:hypothetical protein
MAGACFLGRHLRRTPDSTRRASPACDPTWAALVAKGRTGTATTYSKGGDVPRMRLDLERGAELTTSEPDKGRIRIAKWKPVVPEVGHTHAVLGIGSPKITTAPELSPGGVEAVRARLGGPRE